MIRAERASLIYLDHGKEIYACRDIEIEIHENEFVGILGPSGSGKSSLLFLLSGLKNPTTGRVTFNGSSYSELPERDRAGLRLHKFGFIFQQPYLLGYLTALENVLLVNPSQTDASDQAGRLLEALELGEKLHRFPSDLSGGEKQRVCLARSLFSSPAVIFADEPTASLDHKSGEQVMDLLAEHRKGALVMVTHDPTMLQRADRIFTIEEGRAAELNEEERAQIVTRF